MAALLLSSVCPYKNMKPQAKIKIKDTDLLVIDVINSCCHPRCERKEWDVAFFKIRKMVPRLKKFIKDYKERGGQVIYINCFPWKKKFLAKNLVELYKDPCCRYYSEDKTGFSEDFF
jgi:hypothetical protein